MEWWWIIKLIWGALGVAVACLMLIIAWRARGIVSWNRAIREELSALAREADTATSARRAGISLIQGKCETIFRSLSPTDQVGLDHLRAYVRSIAACFFPDAARPELQISLGHLIKSIDISLSRFDRILQRPGLQRLTSINIKTVRHLYHWSDELLQHPWLKWYATHRGKIERFGMIRFFILPDPFSWSLFLSRKLVILVLMRTLLVDITLFVGKLALNAFDQNPSGPVVEDAELLEKTLEEISQLPMATETDPDPDIADIRRQMVGFSTIMFSSPTWGSWKRAIGMAAEKIAAKHFPDSENPMEEATIGPLLHRSKSWLQTLGKGDNVTIVRYIYKTRLETLFQAKDVTDLVLTPTVRGIIRSSFGAYGWLKWPLKIYRRVKRFTLPRIAMDIGWVLGKKSALVLIYGRTFDHACRELEWVYRMSAAPRGGGKEDRSGENSSCEPPP